MSDCLVCELYHSKAVIKKKKGAVVNGSVQTRKSENEGATG